MISETQNLALDQMEKSVDKTKSELSRVRTGRAQVSMLDAVMVSYYGNPTPLNQVATIACPDGKSFLITPWETAVIKDIEAAILKASLGMSPQSDGKMVRLKVPELTEDRRKDLVKQIKKIVEDGRISVRMARKNANDKLKQLQKDKDISEDEQSKAEKEVQRITDDHIKNLDQIFVDKEKDLMTI
ncbi:MAG: ribosome recycling factor [Bdellovibrionaceae bacterium]|jgi:ribosome recycling factor|nr:ribosome recycling factor [Pseudobdellovibrionaceae bacterium]